MTSSDDDIIQNFDRGRNFGVNKIQDDIKGLRNYRLTDYWPKSDTFEKWTFESDAMAGPQFIVEITKKVLPHGTMWRMHFGQVQQEGYEKAVANIIKSTERVEGYNNFANLMNSTMSARIAV
jgi:hypothetical protein